MKNTMLEQLLKYNYTNPVKQLQLLKYNYINLVARYILQDLHKKLYQKSARHCDNTEKINDIIDQSKFTDLVNYTKFNLLFLGGDIYETLCNHVIYHHLNI